VGQDGDELRPSGVTDALGKAVVLHHARYLQLLDGNSTVRLHDGAGRLVVEITPLVAYLAVRLRREHVSSPSVLAATLLAVAGLLTPRQQLLPASEVPWVG
jgi:hypothetical protein